MGDISELRGLVVIVSFIGITALLMSMIPAEFFTANSERRQVSVPEYFDVSSLESAKYTYNFTVNKYEIEDWSLGGYDWKFIASFDVNSLDLSKKNYWWIIPIGSTTMKWRSTDGIEYGIHLTKQILDTEYSKGKGIKFLCEGIGEPSVGCSFYFAFNNSKYTLPSKAWENDELYALQAMSFDQVNTSTNAWDLIRQIMFFQMPDVHPAINAIIAIPIWVATVYIAFILILRVVGAIFGGGA
jgi:hypothetical protein